MENLVIFFRDQEMTIEQHKAFGRRFGKLHVHPNAPQELPDHPENPGDPQRQRSSKVQGRVARLYFVAMKA
jgi:taurine dioxygenase